MVVEIDWLHAKEVFTVAVIKAVKEHAVEILVQLRGSVFDKHLHLVNELGGDLAVLAFGMAISWQILTADSVVALGARCYYDFTGVRWVNTIDAESRSKLVCHAHIFWEAIIVEEQILEAEWLLSFLLLGSLLSELSEVYWGHKDFTGVFNEHLVVVCHVLDLLLHVADNLG